MGTDIKIGVRRIQAKMHRQKPWLQFCGVMCYAVKFCFRVWPDMTPKGEFYLLVTVAILKWCCVCTCAEEIKPAIAPIDSAAGLYFDEMGQVYFYPTQWKVVSYVNLKPTQVLWKQVKAHQSQIVNYCIKIRNSTWYPLTDCRAFTPYIRTKIRYVEQLKDVIADYLTAQPERIKRGLLDLGGDNLKFLFGTLTQTDAQKYTQHIQELENEQQSFLRISQEQMIILKSAITSFNLTMQKVNKNEKVLSENFQRLNQMVVEEINRVQSQLDSVLLINENIRQVQRGLDECQHTFEILVDAFLHAQDGIIQPQLITVAKVKEMMREESLPDGLDFPSFPSLELSRLISPIIFSKNTYLVYVLQIPLLQPIVYQLYKLQPFPIRQQDNVFVYVQPQRDFIFVDVMRNKYGKMNYQELQACIMPNKFNYVCQETLPIFTYIPNEDCEATLIHPSTSYFPHKVCEQGLLKLEYTYWIPLHMSNEWLYVTPKTEVFTVICGSSKFQLTLQGRGRLFLPPRCKGYSTHSTLYALSTLERNNSQEDVLPLAPVDLDCCLTEHEREHLHEIPLQKPFTNILSSIEELNLASVKISEVQEMIDKEQTKRSEHFKILTSTWGSVVLTILMFILIICCSCCCCCKCCRQCAFWIWDKWTPKECIRHTSERCCIITNINADRVSYHEVPQTPPLTPLSSRSLPLSIQEPPQSRQREMISRRRSPSRVSETWELTEFQTQKSKMKERNGER